MLYFDWQMTEYDDPARACGHSLTVRQNTHREVKAKILERMAEWTEMFSKDPDLGIMEGAYMRLKTQSKRLEPVSLPPNFC